MLVALTIAGCGGETATAPGGGPFVYLSAANSTVAEVIRIKDITGAGRVAYGTLGAGFGNFNNPGQIFVDPAGRIYVADTANNRIVRMDNINGDGFIVCTTGSTGGTFSAPTGVCVDGNGNIYVADSGNNRIVMMSSIFGSGWTTLGAVSAGLPVAGTGTDAFTTPYAVCVDKLGRIYVTDSGNNRIVMFNNISGAGWAALGTPGQGVGGFSTPKGICLDASGNIYVADSANYRIVEMSNISGAGWQSYGGGRPGVGPGLFTSPTGIAIDPSGHIYVADGLQGLVTVSNISGSAWASLSVTGSAGTETPQGVFVR